jgi:hypothetical protein
MGAQLTNAQVVANQLEHVDAIIEVMYERGDEFLNMINQAKDVKKVSSRLMRISLQINPGGNYRSVDRDGGDYGDGSGEAYDVATLTPVFRSMVFAITDLAMEATDTTEQALVEETNRIVAEGMQQFRSALDKELQTNGNGVLGTISSLAGTAATMTIPYGAQLVYNTQIVQIYDTTLTINRSAAAGFKSTVLSADPVTTNTIVFDQLPPGTIATDVIVLDGLTGANPVALFGIKYHQNNATTGVWLNLNRATYPVQLATPRVNGNLGALVPMQPWLAINKIKKSLGLKKLGKLKAHMAVEQSQAWNQLAVTIQIVDRAKRETGEGLDMGIRGAYDSAGNMCGVPITESQNADQTRIDFIDVAKWGRAVMKPMGFHKWAGGKVWLQKYGASGGGAGAMLFQYDHDFQVFTRSPRSGSYIDSLTRPAGF